MAIVAQQLIAEIGVDIGGLERGVGAAKRLLSDFGAKASSSATEAHASFKRLADSGLAQQIGQGMAVGGGVITLALGGAVKAAADFDQSLRNVDSIAHLTQGQFKDLHGQILQLATDPNIRQGPADLAKGMYDIESSGFSGAKAMDILKVSALGASGGMSDTATSSKVLMAVLNSGVGGVHSAKQAMDTLFQSVNLGVYSFSDLATNLGNVLPTAKMLGVTLQDVSAAQAVMTRQGVTLSESTTALNEMLEHILRPSQQAVKVFDALGVSYGQTALKGRPFAEYLQDLIAKTKEYAAAHNSIDLGKGAAKKITGAGDIMAQMFPEVRGFKAGAILSDAGGKQFMDMLKGMGDANGQTMEAVTRQNAGAAAQFEIVKKQVQALAISVGEQLLPALRPLIGLAGQAVAAFTALPEPVKRFLVVGTAVAGVALLAVGGIMSLAASAVAVGGAMAAAGITAGGLLAGIAAIAVPVALVVAGVAALALAWKTDFGGIREVTQKVGADVMGFINSQFGYVKQWFADNMPLIRETVRTVLTAIEQFWQSHGARIMAIIEPLWSLVKTAFSAALHIILATVTLALDVITGHWGDAAKQVGVIVTNLWAVVRSLFVNGGKAIGNSLMLVIDVVLDFGKRLFEGMLNAGQQAINGIVGGIKAGVGKVVKAATDLGHSLSGGVNAALDIHSPSRVLFDAGTMAALGLVMGLTAGTPAVALAADTMGKAVHSHVQAHLSEAQKEVRAFTLDLARQKATLAALRRGDDGTQAATAGKYRAVPGASALAEVKEQIAQIKAAQGEQRRFNEELAKTRAQLKELMAGGNQRAVQVARRFGDIPEGQRKQLADTKTMVDIFKALPGGLDMEKSGTTALGDAFTAALGKAAQKEAQAAQKAAQKAAQVSASIKTFDAEMNARINGAKMQMAGTADQAAVAWQDYLANHGELAKAIAGDATKAAAAFALFKSALTVDKQAEGLTRMHDMMSDIAKQMAQMTAKSPFAAFTASLMVSDGKGGLKLPDGMDMAKLKQVFDAQKVLAQMTAARQMVGQFVDGLRSTIETSLNDVFQHGFKGFFSNVVDGFKKMFQDIAVQYLTNQAMMAIIGAIGGVNLQGQLGLFGGARAAGGPVSGSTPYLVGERGPELFVPNGAGNVVPNHALAGAAGGDQFHVHVTVQGGSSQEESRRSGQQVGQAALAEMQRYQRRNGR